MVIAGIFFFLFGMVVGSFLNVCITRIPEDVSIILPGSRCPECGTAIKFYDNVPVLAWIWLGGKCRACGAPISVMYPLVELGTGLLFVAAFLEYGITQATVKWLFFTCLIIVLAKEQSGQDEQAVGEILPESGTRVLWIKAKATEEHRPVFRVR